jgi:hypothetical protein
MQDFEPSPSELELLVEACRTLDRCEALTTAVREEPLTTVGSRGQTVAHPLLAELRAERLLLARLLSQLGIPGEKTGDDWDGLTASERARRAALHRWHGPKS